MDTLTKRQLPSPSAAIPTTSIRTLSPQQWTIFAAIADAIVPSITADHRPDSLATLLIAHEHRQSALRTLSDLSLEQDASLPDAYLSESATSCPDYKDSVQRLVADYMDSTQRTGFLFILNALNTRAGALLLTGTSTSLPLLSVKHRQTILQQWSNSYIPIYRLSLIHI